MIIGMLSVMLLFLVASIYLMIVASSMRRKTVEAEVMIAWVEDDEFFPEK